jgi:hypothetical protein
MFALLAYNMSGMLVTDHLGAVFRTVLETMRTLFVWLLGLLLFYTPLGMGFLGESWSSWSYLQAAGCVACCLLLFGGEGGRVCVWQTDLCLVADSAAWLCVCVCVCLGGGGVCVWGGGGVSVADSAASASV